MDKVRLKDVGEKKVEEIRSAFRVLKKVQDFENKANMKLFEFLFEERAEHMFVEVFVKRCKRNASTFMIYIDEVARQDVMVNLFADDGSAWDENPLYAHCH